MAGFFDIHSMIAIGDLWDEIAGNVNVLKALMPRDNAGNSIFTDDEINQWWKHLFPGNWREYVTISNAFSQERNGLPAIICQLTDEPVETQFLADNYTVEDDGTQTSIMFVDEQCVITMYAGSPEVVRIMHVIVRAAMLGGVRFLIDAGYESLDYVGGGDIQAMLGLLPEDAGGIVVRTQRWKAKSKVKTAIPGTVTEKNWFIAAADVKYGDYDGGVEPE